MIDVDNEVDRIVNKDTISLIQEQVEKPMTSESCPESIGFDELKDIDKHPERYIEINFIKRARMVDSFYISSGLQSFHYNNVVYEIGEDTVYILPTKKEYFMPTCFYKEGNSKPVDFKNLNKGITGKALSLLYDKNLYTDLFSGEISKYNIFIVILLICSVGCFLVGLYFVIGGMG